MRIRITYIVALTAIPLMTFAVAGGADLNEGAVRLAGTKLQLEERNQVCHVTNLSFADRAKAYSLAIPWPCSFHKNKSGEARIIRSGEYEYLLVESSKSMTGNVHDCETHLRAIRASGKQLYISQHRDKVASCPPFQWDKMVFTELFN